MDSLQRSLVKLAPKPMSMDPITDKAGTPTSIVIENSDGTTTQIITTGSEQDVAGGELDKAVQIVTQAGEEEEEAEAVAGEEGEEPPDKKIKLATKGTEIYHRVKRKVYNLPSKEFFYEQGEKCNRPGTVCQLQFRYL